MMAKPLTDVDKIIQTTLDSYNEKTKAILYKMDNYGNISIKHGYIINRGFYRSTSLTFINIEADKLSAIKMKVAKKEKESLRNTVWFKDENNNELDCLISTIDIFKETKEKQLEKLNQQANLTEKEIKRLDKLKKFYQEKRKEENNA